MAKIEHTSDARVLVGIDVSIHRHEGLIAVPGKSRRRRLNITNCTEDFTRPIAILREYGLPVRIGFEDIGNYHGVLMYLLGMAGFDLKLVSSVALARPREALHNSWDKNGRKDAQVILHMLQISAVQIFQDPMVVGTSDIQELSKTHDAMARTKTELWHCFLTHYLPLNVPVADRSHRSSRTDWFLAFLEMFTSPHMISAMTKDEFTKAAWEVVGRKVEKALMLSDIYETAKASAGLPVSRDSDAIRMFRMMLAEGRSLIRQLNCIEDRAVELLGDRSDFQFLCKMPGIGQINPLTIFAVTGDLRRFHHHRQFLEFRSMDLATVQSGMFRGRSMISKYGNARLRRTLGLAGQTAVL